MIKISRKSLIACITNLIKKSRRLIQNFNKFKILNEFFDNTFLPFLKLYYKWIIIGIFVNFKRHSFPTSPYDDEGDEWVEKKNERKNPIKKGERKMQKTRVHHFELFFIFLHFTSSRTDVPPLPPCCLHANFFIYKKSEKKKLKMEFFHFYRGNKKGKG